MSVPKPDVSLDGACSVIYKNTLYTYSANAFQAIDLDTGAKWKTLSMGVPVEDGVCVGSTPGDDAQAGFYVVGGSRRGGEAMDGAPEGCHGQYQGLQKYTYATKKWETLCPPSDTSAVTQSRKGHNAIYIRGSDSIFMYAGNQDGVAALSSQTYTISAVAPYGSSAWPSSAPPAISPILLPWDDGSVVMLGGDEANKMIMVFGGEWFDTKATVADPLPARMKAALITGDDGSRNLYSFDLTQSPNVVNRIVIYDGNGAPVENAPTIITARDADHSLDARDSLTASSWPTYNSTLASSTIRSSSSMAQGPDGQIVFIGGSDDDVMCIFNARENSWQNVALTFDSDDSQKPLVSSTVTSKTSTRPTSTPTSITTGAATTANEAASATTDAETSATLEASEREPTNPNVILGAAFGSIIGVALLLGLLLFMLRRCHNRKQAATAGRATRNMDSTPSPIANEKGAFHVTEEPLEPPAARFRGHQASNSQSSFSSIAILVGKTEKTTENKGSDMGRKPSNSSDKSNASSISNKEFKSAFGPLSPADKSPISPAPAYDASHVLFDGTANDPSSPPRRPLRPSQTDPEPARRSSGWNRYWSGSSELEVPADPASRVASSLYTDAPNNRMTQDSAALPSYYESRPEINSVNTGSPTISMYPPGTLREGMAGTIERPGSSDSDSYNHYTGHNDSAQVSRESVAEEWPSVPKPWFPASGGLTAPPPQQQAPSRPPPAKPLYSGISQQPQLTEAERSSDMSWLNLGGDSGPPRV